ncbi:hypothetical protein SAMN02745116_02419 [Pilibacter termitis]|uniref:Uncharacterized protein n=1 Tax=Pilibacter termitis TaxID=263852 RepID=A0A1T4R2J2_9ENTE|nr:hypothetical protein [Pilibacter termitis]SKA10262.1 hypothetical protein SAMN02745116_02419 [Pilibacter termitis]
MFDKNFDFLTEWTVSTVSHIYKLLVQNLYFVLSNALFFVFLIFFRFTLNNLLFFAVPILLLLASFSAQFCYLNQETQIHSIKQYFKMYAKVFKNSWSIFLFYTGMILFVVLDVKILFLANINFMLYPLVITGCFLLSSMLYVLLISSDNRASSLTLRKKLTWSIMISYRLPIVTLMNICFVLLTLFCMQNFSLAYICFLGGMMNYYIWKNLTRRFSIELFFEQVSQ